MEEKIRNIDRTRLTGEAWPSYRKEIVQLFAEQEYGVIPEGWTSETAWTGTLEKDGARGRSGKVTLSYEDRSMEIPFVLWLPEASGEKVPCIIYINGAKEGPENPTAGKPAQGMITKEMRAAFQNMMEKLIGNEAHFRELMEDQKAQAGKGPSFLNIRENVDSDVWPVKQLLSDGFAAAAFSIFDLAPDGNEIWKEKGLYPLFYGSREAKNPDNGFGCLAAWAFGASRVLDALLTCPEIDSNRISVGGHSRCGKAALWAAVSDERFETVLSNNSGCCGAALNEGKHGESIASITRIFPAWFCRNFLPYAGKNAKEMPFDQDLLLAAMAPRPLYVTSASRDYWSDPLAEFTSAKRAGEVYEALGMDGLLCEEYPKPDTASSSGMIGYALQKGPHAITPWDWKMFCRFEKEKQETAKVGKI